MSYRGLDGVGLLLSMRPISRQTKFKPYYWIRCISRQSWPKHKHKRIFSTSQHARPPSRTRLQPLLVATCVLTGLTYPFWSSTLYADAAPSPESNIIRLKEVRRHNSEAERKWVIKGNRVYDITEWIPAHPGGEVILRATGGTVDRYWDIFTIHKKKEVYDQLEMYFIGEIDPQDLIDGKVPDNGVEDPFSTDPLRDQSLIMLSDRPCNAETSLNNLESFYTPNSKFYIRNHLWTPANNESDFALTVELPSGDERSYSLQDLKSKFAPVTLTATLQCSGNRRRHMSEHSRSTSGLQWNVGAISNADWTGVRLRDVLADAGFDPENSDNEIQHVHFAGAEAYGASIPIAKALDRYGDVILAYNMNGEQLPRDHGYPLRAIVPGTVAARSVKWLTTIKLSDEESQSQWQQRDYKCFGPNQGGSDVDWSSAPAIQETPVTSAITSLEDISSHTPQERQTLRVYGLEEDAVRVSGYAISGGGRRIVRVDVSADGGQSWHQAELLPTPEADAQGKGGWAERGEAGEEARGREGKADGGLVRKGEDVEAQLGLSKGGRMKGSKQWAWTRWTWVVPKRLAGRVFVVKAVDEAYNIQPGEYEPHYNFRGNLTNAWHRVAYDRGI